jgi:hypothetical protein
MIEQGRVSNGFRNGASDEDWVCGCAGAKIRMRVPRIKKAQNSPSCSFAVTAIEVPGFRNHSHQLGSNPLDLKPNYKF